MASKYSIPLKRKEKTASGSSPVRKFYQVRKNLETIEKQKQVNYLNFLLAMPQTLEEIQEHSEDYDQSTYEMFTESDLDFQKRLIQVKLSSNPLKPASRYELELDQYQNKYIDKMLQHIDCKHGFNPHGLWNTFEDTILMDSILNPDKFKKFLLQSLVELQGKDRHREISYDKLNLALVVYFSALETMYPQFQFNIESKINELKNRDILKPFELAINFDSKEEVYQQINEMKEKFITHFEDSIKSFAPSHQPLMKIKFNELMNKSENFDDLIKKNTENNIDDFWVA